MKRKEIFNVGDVVRQVTATGELGEVAYTITDRMGGTGCMMRQVGRTDYAKQWFDTSMLTHDLATVPNPMQHTGAYVLKTRCIPRSKLVREQDPTNQVVRVYKNFPETVCLQIWSGKRYMLVSLYPAEARAIAEQLVAGADQVEG